MRHTQRQFGGVKQLFTALLVLCALAGLVAWVSYLLADINHRRFGLLSKNGQLIVERGLYLPVGFTPYLPEQAGLAQAYAPVAVPHFTNAPARRVFEERSELDNALFELLGGWAKQAFASGVAADTPHAVAWVSRLELLPSLSEQQRADLRQLRTTASFAQAEAIVAQHDVMIAKALAAYEQASGEPGTQGRLARERQAQLQRCITCLHEPSSPPQKPAPQAAPPR